MSDRRSAADLGDRAEAALGAFPFAERDWEKDARAIEARIAEGSTAAPDDALFDAPFPNEPGEPTAFSATATPLTSSGVRTQSLADIARRSVQQKQSAEREMARASFALAAQKPSAEEAAALREAVSSVRAIEPPLAPAVVAPAAAAPAKAEAAPPPASSHVAPASNVAPLTSARAESPWPKLTMGVGLLALAAAAVLWLKRPEAAAPAPVALIEAPRPAASVAANTTSPIAPAQPAAPTPTAVDPSSLSTETAAAKPVAEGTHAKSASAGAVAAAEQAAPSAGAPSGPAPEKFELEEDKPSAPAAVAAAEKPAEKALPPDPALRPADSSGGALPVKPSTGAVQAALGAVMSGARHCVAGDDAPSSAVVVFSADGHVQNVTVSGPAAGKPAAACIQGQLSRARVQPFAAASFSVNATVRPD